MWLAIFFPNGLSQLARRPLWRKKEKKEGLQRRKELKEERKEKVIGNLAVFFTWGLCTSFAFMLPPLPINNPSFASTHPYHLLPPSLLAPASLTTSVTSSSLPHSVSTNEKILSLAIALSTSPLMVRKTQSIFHLVMLSPATTAIGPVYYFRFWLLL